MKSCIDEVDELPLLLSTVSRCAERRDVLGAINVELCNTALGRNHFCALGSARAHSVQDRSRRYAGHRVDFSPRWKALPPVPTYRGFLGNFVGESRGLDYNTRYTLSVSGVHTSAR